MTNTKKYFGTDGIRGRVGEYPINAEFVLKLGWAVGRVLAQKGGGKVLIGKDTRISGYMFESALEAGLSAAGVDIHLLGPMPTPAIAYLTRTLRAQAGIVISASHNPYQDNGIKFFSSEGCKLPDEIEKAIEAQLEQDITTADSALLGKAVRVVDAPGRYIEFCKSTISAHASLKGMKIVVDCANGATYAVAPCVFKELGADVIEIGNEPNGLNINDGYGSTKPQKLQQATKIAANGLSN
jgi:phosphoglucosamine mutase